MVDARKDKRTLLSLKIRFKSATLEDFIERYSNDISRGGTFIKAQKPLAVGTLLKFDFLLQDQSTLIHGVGRVVWRREEHESDAENPPGMGIKFVKMDPESRSIVERIVEDRAAPGIFEQGKEGVRLTGPSDPAELTGADQTRVRHVSEFLASAFEQGEAGPMTTGAARSGADRARRGSDLGERRAAARGAFSALREEVAQRRSPDSEVPSRGAVSAFGGAAPGPGAGRSSAAPALDAFDAEDDFLEEETTKVKELPLSDYPDADATAIAHHVSPFLAERRPTPVMPMKLPSRSPLEDEVPDLFGSSDSDSFGPAPGELIDPSLLDPSVATVPPRAATVPDPSSRAEEVFQIPKPARPVSDPVRASERRQTRVWLALLLLLLLVFTAGIAALRFGLLDGVIERVAPGSTVSDAPRAQTRASAPPARSATPAPAPAQETENDRTQAREEPAAPEPRGAAQPEAPPAVGAKQQAPMVKLRVLSIPSRAFVSVDGKAVGRTPIDLEYEAGREISIYSKARGFLAQRQKVVMTPGQQPLKLVLSALPYSVDVVSDPPGAKVTVGGAGQGVTPVSFEPPAMRGSLKVAISKDGFKTVVRSLRRNDFVEEPRRMVATISVSLEPQGAVKAAPAPSSSEAATSAPVVAPSQDESVAPSAEAETEAVAKAEAVPEPAPEPVAKDTAEPAPPSETPDVDEP